MSPSSQRSCPSCGRAVSGRSRFCVGCGADLTAATVTEEATAVLTSRSRRGRAVASAAAEPEAEAAALIGTGPAGSPDSDVPAGPDTNLIRALRRASRSSPVAAGFTAALVAVFLVAAVTPSPTRG